MQTSTNILLQLKAQRVRRLYQDLVLIEEKSTLKRILVLIWLRVLLAAVLLDRALCAVCVHSFIRSPGWVYIAQYGLEYNKFAAMMKIPSVIPTFMTPAQLGCFQSPLE